MSTASMTRKEALEEFVQYPVSKDMISYLAAKASTVIQCRSNSSLPTPPSSRTPSPVGEPEIPTLEQFITSVVNRSHVQVPTLMSSLVYLDRLRIRLGPVAQGMRCTIHRIFLASLILAAKNLNDSSPKNSHWARYSMVKGFESFGFSLTEVNLMERQMLMLLEWDLNISENDLVEHLSPFLEPIVEKHDAEMERQRLAELEREQAEWEEEQAVQAMKLEIESRRAAMSPSPVASISQPTLYQYNYATPPTRYLTPPTSHSRGSSRSSSRSPSKPSKRTHSSRKSTSNEYYFSSPPSSTPALSRSGTASSAGSSRESSPSLSNNVYMRSLLPLLDSGKKKLKTAGGSPGRLLARFLSGASGHHSYGSKLPVSSGMLRTDRAVY